MVKEKAAFGAGCFWHVQKVFSETYGVVTTVVGYMGGDEKAYPKPTYKQVCTNKTGYAETVWVEFDNKKITYDKLLDIFWNAHNPMTKNRQGLDFGTQYRSVIFYFSKSQKAKAEKSMKEIQKKYHNRVVTEIKPAPTFFRAEEYHQDYIKKTRNNACGIFKI